MSPVSCATRHPTQHPASPRPREETSALSLHSNKKEEGFVAVPDPAGSRFSFSPLLFDDFGPDSPTPSAAVPELHRTTCLIYHRYWKDSAQGVTKPPGLLGGSKGMGRRWMAEPAALLQAAVCTAGVHQGP